MDKTNTGQLVLWAGTESSFHSFLMANELMTQGIMAGHYATAMEKEEEKPYLLQVDNGIGLVKIHGSLTSKDSPYNRYYDLTSYNDIRNAVLYAAASPDVETIILDVNSGGGTVAGLSDVGTAIRNVNDKVKPVISFTDSGMMSAAYWLGVSAGNVFSSKTANVGSIGVIQMHMEQSKLLEKIGITVTVLRAGEYKALANPVEPLSAKGKQELQNGLDEAYKVFVSHVAEERGLPYDTVDKTMAQGRVFFGAQALSAGLVDGIVSFDQLLNLVKQKA
jgi:capsid assembly protease